jgi:hypothetical protein
MTDLLLKGEVLLNLQGQDRETAVEKSAACRRTDNLLADSSARGVTVV